MIILHSRVGRTADLSDAQFFSETLAYSASSLKQIELDERHRACDIESRGLNFPSLQFDVFGLSPTINIRWMITMRRLSLSVDCGGNGAKA
jgi:hypothetical protein